MRVCKKILSCFIMATVVLLVISQGIAFSENSGSTYTEVSVDIYVSGEGTFHLIEEGHTNVLDTLNLNGLGSFKLSFVEPGNYRYEIFSYDSINTQRYSVLVSVICDEETNILTAKVSIYPTGSEEKFLLAYYPIVVDNPPIVKVVRGIGSSNEVFNFEFRAVSTTADGITDLPMPDGLTGTQKKTVQVTGAGSVEVGWIAFSKPGIYVYEVKEVPESSSYRYDSNVYRVEYEITESDSGLVSNRALYKNGQPIQKDVWELEFVNEYILPYGNNGGIKTGDSSAMLIYSCVFVSSFSVFVISAGILLRRKKQERREEMLTHVK